MENPDSYRNKEFMLPVYFFMACSCSHLVGLWRPCFVYLLMSLRASSSPPGLYELVFEPQLRIKHVPVVVKPGFQPVSLMDTWVNDGDDSWLNVCACVFGCVCVPRCVCVFLSAEERVLTQVGHGECEWVGRWYQVCKSVCVCVCVSRC